MAFAEDIHTHKHTKLKNVGPDDHHRAWNWADEQGFIRTFTLPFCDQYGVTKIKTLLGWVRVAPCMIRADNTYYLFYYKNVGGVYRICVATSSTIDGDYTESPNNPIVPLGVMSQQRNPNVVYDPYDVPSKRWKMWLYLPATTIFYSYSANPDSGWSTPVSIGVTDCYWGHAVLRIGSLWYLGYCKNADKQIYLLVDDNPEFSSPTDLGLILDRGAVGEWDETTVRYFDMAYISGVLYLIYSGQKPTAPILQIGLAFSSHYGLRKATPRTFEKYARNPILTPSGDETYVYCPSLMQVKDKFYIVYTGETVGLCLASIP